MSTGALVGITVAVTRPRERATVLADALALAGARIVFAPTIEVLPVTSFGELDASLAHIAANDWLVFTSVSAVDAVAHRLPVVHRNGVPSLDTVRIAAVGEATAEAATRLFGRVDHPGGGSAESLAASLPIAPGDRVLFVCADRARDVLPTVLAERGALVERVVGYRTVSVDAITYAQAFQGQRIDLLILASPSSVSVLEHVSAINGAQLPPVVCIGPTTEASARAAGLEVAAVATSPSVEGLLDATVRAASSLAAGG